MPYDLPCMSQLALYIFSMHVIGNAHTSTHWKLDAESGKIVIESENSDSKEDTRPEDTDDEREIVRLLWSKPVDFSYNDWLIKSQSSKPAKKDLQHKSKNKIQNRIQSKVDMEKRSASQHYEKPELLSCGDTVNDTIYDHLHGVMYRELHSHMPEPDVAMMFAAGDKTADVDMAVLERKLRKLKKSKPNSINTYNKIGNFWRIKGDTYLSIECFRKVLSVSPNHADTLLSLARVLFNLHYLDNAIMLTRKSLEHISSRKNTWLHHYTLGEILKAYGHFHEASIHFHYTLSLNPDFQPARGHLSDLDGPPVAVVTHYIAVLAIIAIVVVTVSVVSTADLAFFDDAKEDAKSPRYFNRAMAMKCMKQGHKMPRLRKPAK